MTGPEPQRGYTATETAKLTYYVARMAKKGVPTPQLADAIERVKAQAVEREAREDAAREAKAQRGR